MVCFSTIHHVNQYSCSTELDKTRSSGKRMGGSIFSSSTPSAVPSELVPLVEPQQTVTKLVLSTKTSVNAANQEYDRITNPSEAIPSAPVHAARLNGLLKNLANAEGAVAESIKARQALIEGLEKLLGANREALASDQEKMADISTRKAKIGKKKDDVEDSIMRGIPNSNPGSPVASGDGSPGANETTFAPAPEVEALTPPGYPKPPQAEPVPDLDLNSSVSQPPAAGSDLLSSLSTSYGAPSNGSGKKRKLNTPNDFPDLGGDAMDGLDDEVADMLWKENQNGH